jgi:hypothetical protein
MTLAVLAAVAAAQQSHTMRALLVGINQYEPAGTQPTHPAGCQGGRCDLPHFADLHGAINDVLLMRDLLSSSKFGFAPENITVLTNPALPVPVLFKIDRPYNTLKPEMTTRAGLLAVIEKYLVDEPKPGDTVVFYFAGHGSLRVNSKGAKYPTTINSKRTFLDSTLVASDAWTGGFDIRDHELDVLIGKALDKGVHVVALLDSCHSGSAARGNEVGLNVQERSLAFDPRDVAEDKNVAHPEAPDLPVTARANNPALFFTAAQQNQVAKELEFGEGAAKISHGAFTVSLVQALETLPADAPARVVYQRVNALLASSGVSDQNLSIDSTDERLDQPLFGGATSQSKVLRATVLAFDKENQRVLLDAGQLTGIREDSEFQSEEKDGSGRTITLRVTELVGLSRSQATVVSPAKAKIEPGAFFKISKWLPRPVDVLKFWTWPSLDSAELSASYAAVSNSGVEFVSDPTEETWTHMLSWNGSTWELHHVLSGELARVQTPKQENSVQQLGSKLDAAQLKKAMPAGSKLWVNFPPSKELLAQLKLNEPDSLVQQADDASGAQYLLAGTINKSSVAYAWLYKPEYDQGPKTTIVKDHTPGCSNSSPYPVTTQWVPLAEVKTAEALNQYAGLLAKLNGWLNISNTLTSYDSEYFYQLQLERQPVQTAPATEITTLKTDEVMKENDQFTLALDAKERVPAARWVYVLDIDCQGKGTLLYPKAPGGNQFPDPAGSPHHFKLPGIGPQHIVKPFGIDTILYITTEQPLSDPFVLNFEGVGASRSATRGAINPLEQLLSDTSAGTRGTIPELPSNWQIESLQLKSVPLP